jgi:hypothetical protein
MAKSVKASKAVQSIDGINADLKASFEAVVNLEAELAVYEKAVSMLNAGTISVRGLKVTIESANERGALPTIKPSTAQDFLRSSVVRSLAGGKDKSLKDILNATIQARRSFGAKELDTRLESGEFKSFAELVKATPKQGEKAKAEKATLADVKAVLAHADGVVALALKSLRELSGEEALIKDVASAKALIKVLEHGIATNAHPAIRSKVSA